MSFNFTLILEKVNNEVVATGLELVMVLTLVFVTLAWYYVSYPLLVDFNSTHLIVDLKELLIPSLRTLSQELYLEDVPYGLDEFGLVNSNRFQFG